MIKPYFTNLRIDYYGSVGRVAMAALMLGLAMPEQANASRPLVSTFVLTDKPIPASSASLWW